MGWYGKGVRQPWLESMFRTRYWLEMSLLRMYKNNRRTIQSTDMFSLLYVLRNLLITLS